MRKFLLPLCLFLAACGDDPKQDATPFDPATTPLMLDAETYLAGTPGTLTLTNNAGFYVGVNLCATAWENAAGDDVPEANAGTFCPLDAATDVLAPGDSQSQSFTVKAEVPPGTYHLTTQVQVEATLYDVHSADFTVLVAE